MNLQQPNSGDHTQTANRAKTVVPSSGLCTRCTDGCKGNCEVFQATMRGRELPKLAVSISSAPASM